MFNLWRRDKAYLVQDNPHVTRTSTSEILGHVTFNVSAAYLSIYPYQDAVRKQQQLYAIARKGYLISTLQAGPLPTRHGYYCPKLSTQPQVVDCSYLRPSLSSTTGRTRTKVTRQDPTLLPHFATRPFPVDTTNQPLLIAAFSGVGRYTRVPRFPSMHASKPISI
jgi:hypothetical protein